ncbi:MAG: hypothetical protein WB809_00220 [Thermoplasmata archaeon]
MLETFGAIVLLFLVVPLYMFYGEEMSLLAGAAAVTLFVAGALVWIWGIGGGWILTIWTLVALGAGSLLIGGLEALRYWRFPNDRVHDPALSA